MGINVNQSSLLHHCLFISNNTIKHFNKTKFEEMKYKYLYICLERIRNKQQSMECAYSLQI